MFENSPINEPDLQIEATDSFFECLKNLEAEPFVESEVNQELKDPLTIAESIIRPKVESLMKSKLEVKLGKIKIDEEDFKALEVVVAEVVEEVVQEELDTFKTTLDIGEENESEIDPYGPPEGCSGFYWSGEDCCEINFYD